MTGFTRSFDSNANYVLGIDVGGTTLKYQLFSYEDGNLVPVTGYEKEKKRDTERGLEKHTDQIASIIAEVANDVSQTHGGKLAAVGIGSPGRFRDDGTIKPGTNTNMEIPELKDFDNVNLRKAYAAKLPKELQYLASKQNTLVVRNDGDAALMGIVDRIKKDAAGALVDQHGNAFRFDSAKGNTLAYIGIGTGVGHAIMFIDPNGTTQFKTDGHASKLWVDVPASDIAKVEQAKDRWNAMHANPDEKIDIVVDHEHSRVRAEDLLRFPILCGMAGVADGKELDAGITQHKDALEFAGTYMARLINVIRSGVSEDVNGPEQGWRADDKQHASRTSDYVIGGGIMKDKPLAEILIGSVNNELVRLGAEHVVSGDKTKPIRLVSYSGDNPAIEAAAGLAVGGLQNQL